jgi:tRNA(Ile)-lysidine synthase
LPVTVPPLDQACFAARMAALGPFERQPIVAVAVSGGADSLALTLLADHWARGQGGKILALTVDHRLRPASTDEAVQVGQWLAARGIDHQILAWEGEKPATGIQAAARQARYALLGEACRRAGILHLLLAHHQDDQAETLLARLARGSGVDGLAAMAPLVETKDLRLLRPLLAEPHDRLVATLTAWGQPWLDDPSNQSPRFQRVRLRQSLAEEGMDATKLAATATRLGRARQALEAATAALAVRAVQLHPAGWARLDPKLLAEAPDELGLRLLARLTRTIGGAGYPPRLERLERLHGELRAGLAGRRTFAGCVLAPSRAGVVVCREPAAVSPGIVAKAGEVVTWDGRFTLRLGGAGEGRIEALGPAGWLKLRDLIGKTSLPAPVRPTLPVLIDQHGISAAPHLGYKRVVANGPIVVEIVFTPASALVGVGHCLV